MKKGEPAWNKGLKRDRNKYPNMGHHKPHSLEAKKKMSVALSGHLGYWKGREMSEEHKLNLSKSHIGKRGEESSNWRGGVTTINQRIRGLIEYRLWREAVFKRDDFTCLHCGLRGVELHADHIKPFALYPELRFAIDNGRTLCVPCHRLTPTYGGRSNQKRHAFASSPEGSGGE